MEIEDRPVLDLSREEIRFIANLKYDIPRIVIVFFACILAGGSMHSFPTIEMVLLRNGLFHSLCEGVQGTCEAQLLSVGAIYSPVMAVSFVVGFFTGLFYDKFNARVSAVAGALFGAVGALIVYVSLLREDLNWMVYIGMTLSDCAGALNNMAIYGFLYHYPKNQALILTFGSVSYLISGFLGQIMFWLEEYTVITNGKSFWFTASCCILSAVLCSFAVPNKKEYYDAAESALGYRPHRKPIFQTIKNTFSVMKMLPGATMSYYLLRLVYTTLLILEIGQMTSLANHFISKEAGEWIGKYYIYISMLMSCIQFISAMIFDRFGIIRYMLFAALCLLSQMAVFFLYPGSPISLIVGMFTINILFVWGNRWVPMVAPPELIGNYKGIMNASVGVFQFIISIIISSQLKHLADMMIIFGVLSGLTVMAYAFHLTYLITVGIPDTPPKIN